MQVGSWSSKFMLAAITAGIAKIVAMIIGWWFMFVWYIVATLSASFLLIPLAVRELWTDYGPERN